MISRSSAVLSEGLKNINMGFLTSAKMTNGRALGSVTRTASSGSSSCEHRGQSVTGAAGCPAALPGSPSPPPRWETERPPARRPGSGRTGTCPGSSAPGPLCHNDSVSAGHKGFKHKRVEVEAPRRVSPWLRTPSSSSTCHMPTACRRERTQELCCICQSTSSVPTQHCLGDTRDQDQVYQVDPLLDLLTFTFTT